MPVGFVSRFIPTRVGNTGTNVITTSSYTVHPHARGEHATMNSRSFSGIGSSPRAWGTRAERAAVRGLSRFIPTRVGNTSSRWLHITNAPVHPHARGEHSDPLSRA